MKETMHKYQNTLPDYAKFANKKKQEENRIDEIMIKIQTTNRLLSRYGIQEGCLCFEMILRYLYVLYIRYTILFKRFLSEHKSREGKNTFDIIVSVFCLYFHLIYASFVSPTFPLSYS